MGPLHEYEVRMKIQMEYRKRSEEQRLKNLLNSDYERVSLCGLTRREYVLEMEIRRSKVQKCVKCTIKFTEQEFLIKNISMTYNYGKCPACTKEQYEYNEKSERDFKRFCVETGQDPEKGYVLLDINVHE